MVCYPAGAGGSFLGSALHCIFNNAPIIISKTGHCHLTTAESVPHYVPTSDIVGIKNELTALESIKLPIANQSILKGHVRNLIAMQSLCYDLWFIKITFDQSNPNELEFLHRMLDAKMPMRERLISCYDQIKPGYWPDRLEDFLILPECYNLFKQQNLDTLTNWFWVENQSTKSRTIELSLQDLFLGVPGNKLSQWFDKEVIDKLFDLVKNYQNINKSLYPDTIALLEHTNT